MGGGFLWTKPGIQNLRTCKRSPQKMTKEERRLWYDLLKQLPTAVNRQKVIGNYIVDFYCAEAKAVIELAGLRRYGDDAKQDDA